MSALGTPEVLRAVGLLFGMAVLSLAAVASHTMGMGEAEMRRSDRAFHDGDIATAGRHARRAASSAVPGAPHDVEAYERLQAIARGAETGGDFTYAAVAWRSVWAAAIESDSWAASTDTMSKEAELNLQRLARHAGAASPDASASTSGVPGSTLRWLLPIGFLLTLGGLLLGASRGLGADGRLRVKAAAGSLCLLLSGMALGTLAAWTA